MKKTPLEQLNSRKIALPQKGATRLLRFLVKVGQLNADVTYKYAFDKKQMVDKQVILLADHATTNSFKYVLHGYKFANPNIVASYQSIFAKGMFGYLLKIGVIPKKLYQKEGKAVKEMLQVLKMGGSLCIFPEGIQSASGSAHPIFPATAKFLKRAGVTVVLCKSFGAYLARPRYKRRSNKGRQEFCYEILFSAEDLQKLSVQDIHKKLVAKFAYNDFEWNKVAQNKYKGKEPLAKGINKLLYRCPKCGSEFTIVTDGERIVCTNCENTVVVDEYYQIYPQTDKDFLPYATIDAWYKAQRKYAQMEAKQGFCYQYECEMYDFRTDKLYDNPLCCCGEGVVTLTEKGLRYQGTRLGERVDLFFDVGGLPSLIFTPNLDNSFYYNGMYYNFRPKRDCIKVAKYTLLVEEAHRLADPILDQVSKQFYGF